MTKVAPKTISPKKLQSIITDLKAGASIRQTATKHKVSVPSVANIRKLTGLVPPVAKPADEELPPAPINDMDIDAMLAKGLGDKYVPKYAQNAAKKKPAATTKPTDDTPKSDDDIDTELAALYKLKSPKIAAKKKAAATAKPFAELTPQELDARRKAREEAELNTDYTADDLAAEKAYAERIGNIPPSAKAKRKTPPAKVSNTVYLLIRAEYENFSMDIRHTIYRDLKEAKKHLKERYDTLDSKWDREDAEEFGNTLSIAGDGLSYSLNDSQEGIISEWSILTIDPNEEAN